MINKSLEFEIESFISFKQSRYNVNANPYILFSSNLLILSHVFTTSSLGVQYLIFSVLLALSLMNSCIILQCRLVKTSKIKMLISC
jgi:hypothetical protein